MPKTIKKRIITVCIEYMGIKSGQHFITYLPLAQKVVDTLQGDTKDTVIEVGPGKGILTNVLLEKGYRVYAIEKDKVLCEHLHNTYTNHNIDIVCEDVLSTKKIVRGDTFHVVSNVPYYITGRFIKTFLSLKRPPKSMVLIIQKEVAERIARDTKQSILSLAVQYYGKAKYIKTIPPSFFSPPPKVHSALIHITNIHSAQSKKHEALFFEIIHKAFQYKRKKVISNIKTYKHSHRIMNYLTQQHLHDARAEDISFKHWYDITSMLLNSSPQQENHTL